jgi:hypothetical protein
MVYQAYIFCIKGSLHNMYMAYKIQVDLITNWWLYTKCLYRIYTHKPKDKNKYKYIVTHDHYVPTSEEIQKYCNVKGESAFFTCPWFGRGFESLKTESIRTSQYIQWMHGMYSLFRNWSINQGHDRVIFKKDTKGRWT